MSRMRVLVVCSSGGHLTQAIAMTSRLPEETRFLYATFAKPDALGRLQDVDLVPIYYPTNRNVGNACRNLALAWRTLRNYRPDVVLSTGAGAAVPFLWLAKVVFGVFTLYAEPVDRISQTTLTARLVRPVTDVFLGQWETQLPQFKRRVSVPPCL